MTGPEKHRRVELVAASRYRRRRVRFLVGYEGLIPIGMLTALIGYQGDGKTLLICLMAANETQHGRRVVIATVEDEIESVLRPRLEAAGADLELVTFTEIYDAADQQGDLLLPDHGELLVDAIEKHNPSLFVLDPLEAFLGGSVDSWKSPDVRRALKPLSTAAERADCAAVVVGYLNRSAGTRFLDRVAESMAFTRAARSVLLLAPEPGDETETRRVLALGKTNLAPRGTKARTYRIEPVHLPHVPANPELGTEELEPVNTARIVFDSYAEGWTADRLLAAAKKAEREQTKGETETQITAREFLEQILMLGQPVEVRGIYAAAAQLGLSESAVKRAKAALGVLAGKREFTGAWTWHLPPSAKGSPTTVVSSATSVSSPIHAESQGFAHLETGPLERPPVETAWLNQETEETTFNPPRARARGNDNGQQPDHAEAAAEAEYLEQLAATEAARVAGDDEAPS